MTLEQALAQSIVSRIAALPVFSGVRIVAGNDDTEQSVPRCVVNVTRHGVFIPNVAVYSCKVDFEIVANAFPSANPDATTSGNQNVELLFDKLERSMTGDVTTLTNSNVSVFGAIYDGSVSDKREKQIIHRNYDLTLIASPI
jgi:hypothetical protein